MIWYKNFEKIYYAIPIQKLFLKEKNSVERKRERERARAICNAYEQIFYELP